MNGNRIRNAPSIEDRLAAIAVTVNARHPIRSPFPPDYADFRAAFAPLVQAELLLARLEALSTPPAQILQRRRELVGELLALNLDPAAGIDRDIAEAVRGPRLPGKGSPAKEE